MSRHVQNEAIRKSTSTDKELVSAIRKLLKSDLIEVHVCLRAELQ